MFRKTDTDFGSHMHWSQHCLSLTPHFSLLCWCIDFGCCICVIFSCSFPLYAHGVDLCLFIGLDLIFFNYQVPGFEFNMKRSFNLSSSVSEKSACSCGLGYANGLSYNIDAFERNMKKESQ